MGIEIYNILNYNRKQYYESILGISMYLLIKGQPML